MAFIKVLSLVSCSEAAALFVKHLLCAPSEEEQCGSGQVGRSHRAERGEARLGQVIVTFPAALEKG